MFELTNYLFYLFETNYNGFRHNLGQIEQTHLHSCGHFSFYISSEYFLKITRSTDMGKPLCSPIEILDYSPVTLCICYCLI